MGQARTVVSRAERGWLERLAEAGLGASPAQTARMLAAIATLEEALEPLLLRGSDLSASDPREAVGIFTAGQVRSARRAAALSLERGEA